MADTVAVKDLRSMPAEELRGKVDTLRQELWQHRVKAKNGALQQVHLMRAIRRQVARIQTVLSEQRLEADKQPAKPVKEVEQPKPAKQPKAVKRAKKVVAAKTKTGKK